MNIVLLDAFYKDKIPLTGIVFDAFEYFIAIYEHNPEVKLVLLNSSKQAKKELLKVVENRYDLDDIQDYVNNVVCMSSFELLSNEFNKVLIVDYTTIYKTKHILRAKEIIVIVEFDGEKYRYPENLNVSYYGEMPFVQKDIQYNMKFLFHRFKNLKKVEKNIYVNSPNNNDKKFVHRIYLPNKPIIWKSRNHLDNLFEQFDHYVYYHANLWFDPHPRLFHECFFYGKDITYVNNPKIKDGSWYRWRDLDNGLDDRMLNKEDEVVQKFI